MVPKILNIGFGNFVVASRVVAIVAPSSSPIKRLKEGAREAGMMVDATQGRKTRSIVITDSNHVILSSVHAYTVASRFVYGEREIGEMLGEGLGEGLEEGLGEGLGEGLEEGLRDEE